VETVGDKYMAVSGLPEPCRCHARCIARLALDMMDLAADEVQIDGEPVVCTSCLHFAGYILLHDYVSKSFDLKRNDNIKIGR